MKLQFFLLISLLLIFTSNEVIAQVHSTGANFDLKTIAATPQKVTLSLRSFQSMPVAYSLEKYCPTPGNQGNYGTCVAFANGYGVATLLYAKAHNITDKVIINKYIFSPTFLYEQIKNTADNDCQKGADPIKALLTMMQMGEALLKTVPYNCGSSISTDAVKEAFNYRISDASILYANGVKDYDKPEQARIDLTKKALLEGSPVSTGFNLPETFFKITSDVWEPSPGEVLSDWKHNGHAMVVVGYDDNKAGGAFRILNSWGTGWADKGYVWIKYPDYAKWCIMALQVFGSNDTPPPDDVKPDPKPQPIPAPLPKPGPEKEKAFGLSGNIEFKLNTGTEMRISKTSTRNLTVEEDAPGQKEDLVAYKMTDTYKSGDAFRFYLNIDSEAYVYAFATDLTGKINRILPFDDNTSTHVGANSIIAFPSDTKVIKLDDQKGTDYLLILYAAQKLDAKIISEKMNGMTGALSYKIKMVLGNKLIDKSNIRYDDNKAGFSTKNASSGNPGEGELKKQATGTVVPLMIEIKHT